MSVAASVVVEGTILRCRGLHPYASKLPEKFGARQHDVQVGFPVPFQCRATGRVWRRGEPGPLLSSLTNGHLLIHVSCACGAVTEYEVVRSDA